MKVDTLTQGQDREEEAFRAQKFQQFAVSK
jgi:hypothetical protein